MRENLSCGMGQAIAKGLYNWAEGAVRQEKGSAVPPPLIVLESPFWLQNLRVLRSSSLLMRLCSGAGKRQLISFSSTDPILSASMSPTGLSPPPVSWITAVASYFDRAH